MKERNEIDPALFSTGAHILEKSNNGTKYQIECDTPNGTMQCIHLFPGIDLAYTSFQAFSCFSRNKAMPHILEIAYCSAGRYECEYKRDYFTYLGEGDIASWIACSLISAWSFRMFFSLRIALRTISSLVNRMPLMKKLSEQQRVRVAMI